MLLFGLHTSRILQLTTNNVSSTGQKTTLTIGAHHIELPPKVAEVIAQQRHHATTAYQASPPRATPWLFPGALATQPIHPAHMCTLLARHGIDAGEGRHAALVDLAADLPAPVLASLIGVNITTALNWSQRAQRDWSTYLAARNNEMNTPHQNARPPTCPTPLTTSTHPHADASLQENSTPTE